MKHGLALMGFAATVLSGSMSFGQEDIPTRIAEEFVGICAQNAGRTDKVKAYADVLKFESLPPEMALALGPQDPDARFSGWMVKSSDDSILYLLGVSEADFKGVRIQTCVVANPDVDTVKTLLQVTSLLNLGSPSDDFEQMGQRTRIWMWDEFVNGSAIYLTHQISPEIGVSFAIMAPKQGTQ